MSTGTRAGGAEALSALFENTRDAMMLIQGERFLACNSAAAELFGLENRDDIADVHPSQISPEIQPDGTRSVDGVTDAFKTAAQEGSIQREWLHTRVDGTQFWAEVTITSISHDGEPMFYSSVRDITDRKKAEDEIRRSQERFETLFEHSPDPIMLIVDGRYVDCNQAALDMLGADNKSIIRNTDPADISPEYQPDGKRSSDKTGELIGLTLEKGRLQFEWVHLRLNGEEFWVEVALSVVDLDGQQAIYTVWRDIAERKEAEQRIKEQAEAISELSTPVVKLWDEVILLPIVGMMDTERSQQMTERVLTSVVQDEARVVILDVTGVAVIDTAVARHLLQTVNAVRILGAEVVITGFSPASAQTLAQLGVDFSELKTRGSLRAGVEEALTIVGRQVS